MSSPISLSILPPNTYDPYISLPGPGYAPYSNYYDGLSVLEVFRNRYSDIYRELLHYSNVLKLDVPNVPITLEQAYIRYPVMPSSDQFRQGMLENTLYSLSDYYTLQDTTKMKLSEVAKALADLPMNPTCAMCKRRGSVVTATYLCHVTDGSLTGITYVCSSKCKDLFSLTGGMVDDSD